MSTPEHIVLFPDGNRRWAREHGLDTLDGHLKGQQKFNDFLRCCKQRGVKIITVFGFSTENWNRTPREVQYLMELFEKYLGEGIEDFTAENVRVTIVGQKDRLPASLQAVIQKVEQATKNNTAFRLNLAVSYGGKWDITQAVQQLVAQGIPAAQIT